jgi:tetratricopeptide (TPR) repeat protein
MFAKSMRHAAAGIALLASAVVSGRAQVPAAIEVYRTVAATYVKTGDPAAAVKPILGWERKTLEAAVADTIASADSALIEAAAVLHLEIGVAIAGVSTPSSQGHIELGSKLIDGIVPLNPAVAKNLSAERAQDIALTRATYLGVAGSAFLSVNDVFRARSYFARALKITPKSPAILTLQGTADEIDGAVLNPDDVESLLMKTRAARERNRLLTSADLLYRRALELDPDYALAQIRLGRVQYHFRNLKQATEWLTKGTAGAKDPGHKYLAAMFTGALLQEQKDLAGASAAFERALELAPRSQNAIVALAYVELLSGRANKAQALARSFTGTANSDEGWWAYKNGTLDHAGLQWLRKRVRK